MQHLRLPLSLKCLSACWASARCVRRLNADYDNSRLLSVQMSLSLYSSLISDRPGAEMRSRQHKAMLIHSRRKYDRLTGGEKFLRKFRPMMSKAAVNEVGGYGLPTGQSTPDCYCNIGSPG